MGLEESEYKSRRVNRKTGENLGEKQKNLLIVTSGGHGNYKNSVTLLELDPLYKGTRRENSTRARPPVQGN